MKVHRIRISQVLTFVTAVAGNKDSADIPWLVKIVIELDIEEVRTLSDRYVILESNFKEEVIKVLVSIVKNGELLFVELAF